MLVVPVLLCLIPQVPVYRVDVDSGLHSTSEIAYLQDLAIDYGLPPIRRAEQRYRFSTPDVRVVTGEDVAMPTHDRWWALPTLLSLSLGCVERVLP
jgi:hypothetical protein